MPLNLEVTGIAAVTPSITQVELTLADGGMLPPPTVFAMGMVAERYADQGRQLRARFPKVYGKVRGRPWKELQVVMKEAAAAHASVPASTEER